ncbi:MAG: hypothetical protein KAS32_04965 [Candidatus Peribacteraceae bacterium]|nr:hypothetical protein [Candidatus Peribacteraceae bacterium]
MGFSKLKLVKEEKLPTGFPVHTISYSDLKAELHRRGIDWMCKPLYVPDYEVKYTNLESWKIIAPYLVSPADKYIEDFCDCDDYAKMASAKSAFDFGLNGCLECFGSIPLGRHAFNLLVSLEDFFIMEPNAGFPIAGEVFPLHTNNYNAKSWK